MGDIPHQSAATGEFPRQDAPAGALLASSIAAPGQAAADYPSAYSPSQHHQQQQQHYGTAGGTQHAFSSQLDMAQPQGPARTGPSGPSGPYNMNAMAGALPQATYNNRSGQYAPGPGQQRFSQPSMPATSMAAQAPVSPYGVQNAMAPVANQQYYVPQNAHMAQYYPAPLSAQVQQAGMHSRANPGYYPNAPFVSQQPHPVAHYYYPQAAQFHGQTHMLQGQFLSGQYMPSSTPLQTDPRLPQSQTGEQPSIPAFATEQGQVSTGDRQNVVRGPPRKPRQSGHAIWIGNLPPQTDLMSLVHHVCKEAGGLESLFLISKSNCAFANFRDEQTCIAAQQKLHDSKFQSVRLVSRLRKSTVEGATGVTAPTGPAASASHVGNAAESSRTRDSEAGGEDGTTGAPTPAPSSDEPKGKGPVLPALAEGSHQKDKFFILKSLTVEDLENSVRTSTWATQSHNEDTLNNAFKNAENVYLVFSANKSGEYFGYARMTSPINDDPAAAIEFAPKAQSSSDLDLPKAIPTEATEFAPKGRIIDDSARGTIFWEAERDDQGLDGSSQDEDGASVGGSVGGDTNSVRSGHEGAGAGGESSKAWGKPFRLEWLSTARLPFYRTRGLRNPWNSNREVKIARDGTELEPSVGRKLIGMFHRMQMSSPAAMAVAPTSPVAAGGAAAGGTTRGPSVLPVIAGFPPTMQPPSHQPQ
ncbi:zinc finger CCCH domain-containing protein 45 [Diplogelasinospora grovesii]|uniref:Zinc finger CCCH domain-containing protein 45 n=1 Tax=Diplogelasinospora grovesii TaxID=303347 RepID=A0AAN6NAV2_9PEZI|nr:zinc finger CCCH domain-containing protein 45 [Diplogelasinospora grovesii]